MNKLVLIAVLLFSFNGFSQDIFGKWKTFDDITGEEKSIVEIFKRNGKVYGKIIDILNPENINALCKKCSGDNYNKPILGLELIQNMEKDGEYYKKGTILDPENGKTYKLRLMLTEDNKDILQIRGYIGFLYETKLWERVKE